MGQRYETHVWVVDLVQWEDILVQGQAMPGWENDVESKLGTKVAGE